MSVICDEFGYVQYPKVKRSDRKTIISNWINVMVLDHVSTIRKQGILYSTVLFIVLFCRKNWRIKRRRGKRGGNAASRWWARIQTIQLVLIGYLNDLNEQLVFRPSGIKWLPINKWRSYVTEKHWSTKLHLLKHSFYSLFTDCSQLL